jgi:hypothetical protein
MRCRSGKARWGTTRRLAGAALGTPPAALAQTLEPVSVIGGMGAGPDTPLPLSADLIQGL